MPTNDLGSQRDKYEMSDRMPENGGLSPRFCSRLRNPNTQQHGATPVETFERQFSRFLAKVQLTIERNEMRLAEQDRKDIIRLEWQQVALVVDRLLLLLFIILTVGVTLGIILESPHSANFLFGVESPHIQGSNQQKSSGSSVTTPGT